MSLQAASAAVAEMVEAWERPPEVAAAPVMQEAPRMAMRPPERPRAAATEAPSRPAARRAPGLAVPRPEALPDRSVTAPPPPPPAPEAEREPPPDTRPVPAPERIARPAPPDAPKPQTTARSNAPQKARGHGGGADAGAAARQRAATLSADQRQSLTAQWGAEVRRKIERGKRYPHAARGASGTVRLRITLGRDGSLHGVALAASSGHSALDDAALRAVRSARRFPPAPRALSQPSYTFTLPMTFAR